MTLQQPFQAWLRFHLQMAREHRKADQELEVQVQSRVEFDPRRRPLQLVVLVQAVLLTVAV